MKKIFCAAGILAYSFVSAQQNDFFDIQKQWQERIKKNSKKIPPSLMLFRQRANTLYLPKSFPLVNRLYILPNGNKVYLLGDNMPCIVPDMSPFNMPNIAKHKEYFQLLADRIQGLGKIPNEFSLY